MRNCKSVSSSPRSSTSKCKITNIVEFFHLIRDKSWGGKYDQCSKIYDYLNIMSPSKIDNEFLRKFLREYAKDQLWQYINKFGNIKVLMVLSHKCLYRANQKSHNKKYCITPNDYAVVFAALGKIVMNSKTTTPELVPDIEDGRPSHFPIYFFESIEDAYILLRREKDRIVLEPCSRVEGKLTLSDMLYVLYRLNHPILKAMFRNRKDLNRNNPEFAKFISELNHLDVLKGAIVQRFWWFK